MAVAGFDDSEFDVTQQENVLLIHGKALEEEAGKTFLHRTYRSTGLWAPL
jgi:HSP20 family molecular chaperone IbpA